jgi:hypothetical protein
MAAYLLLRSRLLLPADAPPARAWSRCRRCRRSPPDWTAGRSGGRPRQPEWRGTATAPDNEIDVIEFLWASLATPGGTRSTGCVRPRPTARAGMCCGSVWPGQALSSPSLELAKQGDLALAEEGSSPPSPCQPSASAAACLRSVASRGALKSFISCLEALLALGIPPDLSPSRRGATGDFRVTARTRSCGRVSGSLNRQATRLIARSHGSGGAQAYAAKPPAARRGPGAQPLYRPAPAAARTRCFRAGSLCAAWITWLY